MSGPFAARFLAADPIAESFLPAAFRNSATRIQIARRRVERRISDQLMQVLWTQDQDLPPSESRHRHLDLLAKPGTVAVVTGQQMGLFLGPLYTFYKAASAIAVAKAIESEAGVPCVPLFWLQTEDHDFPEINHCYVAGTDGQPLRLSLADDVQTPDRARISIEHRVLGSEISELLDRLAQCLGELPGSGEFLTLLRTYYSPGQKLSTAFAGVLSAIFSREGLIFLNPRDAKVAQLAAPIYRKSIVACDDIAEALLAQSQALSDAGFDAQVHIRPASPLVFYHPHRAEGPRFRLQRYGSKWSLVGGDGFVSTEEILEQVSSNPLRFSTSALLRPIVQDALLPTVAYVAGPGELNYFAQLPALYRFFELSAPMIVPRARFRCLEPSTRSLLARVNLSPDQIERPRDEIIRGIAARASGNHPSPEQVSERLWGPIAQELDRLETLFPSVDPNLISAVQRTRGTIDHALTRLVERYGRSLAERDAVASDRVDRLQGALFPKNIPQERFYSLASFACRVGLGEFKDRVLGHLMPFATEVHNLEL